MSDPILLFVLLFTRPAVHFRRDLRAPPFLGGDFAAAARKGSLEIACAQEFGLRVQGERPLRRGRVAAQPVPGLPFHEVSSGQHETRRYVLSVINGAPKSSIVFVIAKITRVDIHLTPHLSSVTSRRSLIFRFRALRLNPLLMIMCSLLFLKKKKSKEV